MLPLVGLISWGAIVYGASLSAAVAGLVVVAALRERQPAVVVGAVLATAISPVGWNAILRATHSATFFTDAPVALLPASWQDFGSGVFTLAGVSLLLAVGPMRAAGALRVAKVAASCAVVAFLVDVYLY